MHQQERLRTRLYLRRDTSWPLHAGGRLPPRFCYNHRGAVVDRKTCRTRLRRRERRLQDLGERVAARSRCTSSRGCPREPRCRRSTSRRSSDIVDATRTWDEDLVEAVRAEHGEEAGARLSAKYVRAFPRLPKEDFAARVAVTDLKRIEALATPQSILNLYHEPDWPAKSAASRSTATTRSLTAALPVFTHMGLEVTDERPLRADPRGWRWGLHLRLRAASQLGDRVGAKVLSASRSGRASRMPSRRSGAVTRSPTVSTRWFSRPAPPGGR
ncbi:MAG: NAD-glutamate dehydrogenase [Actinomycetales bacterium]|nr:NAD-glutamate dehydrogenase [Actinomycetales bacterium]